MATAVQGASALNPSLSRTGFSTPSSAAASNKVVLRSDTDTFTRLKGPLKDAGALRAGGRPPEECVCVPIYGAWIAFWACLAGAACCGLGAASRNI